MGKREQTEEVVYEEVREMMTQSSRMIERSKGTAHLR